MPSEIETLIDESLQLRSQVQKLQERYDANRMRILELLTASNQKYYIHGNCKAFRTEACSVESVSKELFIQALKEVDIPRDKKIFIWNRSMKEVRRPTTVLLQTLRGPSNVLRDADTTAPYSAPKG